MTRPLILALGREVDLCEASLAYIVSFILVRTTQCNSVSKNTAKSTKEQDLKPSIVVYTCYTLGSEGKRVRNSRQIWAT